MEFIECYKRLKLNLKWCDSIEIKWGDSVEKAEDIQFHKGEEVIFFITYTPVKLYVLF